MSSLFTVAYGLACYVFFLVSFVYSIGFVGDVSLLPKTLDSGTPGSPLEAVAVNCILLAIFGIQHSVMARAGFKRAWTRVVPVVVERSTYVLAASLALALVLWQWRPIPQPVIWEAEGTTALVLQGIFWLGWGVALSSSFLINHFELFGLRQVFFHSLNIEPPAPEFRTPGYYKFVRHPLYFGLLLGFWAAPRMTAGHLLFAAGCTAYILVGVYFEERDLVELFGHRYRNYRRQVGMLLPWRKKAS